MSSPRTTTWSNSKPDFNIQSHRKQESGRCTSQTRVKRWELGMALGMIRSMRALPPVSPHFKPFTILISRLFANFWAICHFAISTDLWLSFLSKSKIKEKCDDCKNKPRTSIQNISKYWVDQNIYRCLRSYIWKYVCSYSMLSILLYSQEANLDVEALDIFVQRLQGLQFAKILFLIIPISNFLSDRQIL